MRLNLASGPSRADQVWSDAEVVVLCAIFSACDFSVGDDARLECRLIAACFERTPATVDRQWRNIKNYMAYGDAEKKISNTVKKWTDVLLSNTDLVRRLALRYCEENDWPLDQLIKERRDAI